VAKILITGGAGFIGTHTAEYYLSRGHEVVVFDNFSRIGARENVSWLRSLPKYENLTVLKGDIRKPGALDKVVRKLDLVVHLAAQVAVTTSVKNPREDFEINALGTFNLLESVRACSPDTVVLFASTNKVYGEMENLTVKKKASGYFYADCPDGISESQNLDFHSPYGCSKGAAEQYVRDYSRIYGLKTVVFRQSCIYGTRQFGVEDQGWVSWFTIASILRKPMTIYGDGYQVRDVLYVTDLVRAYDLAFRNIRRTSGKIYNIGGGAGNSLSVRQLLKTLEKKLGLEIRPRHSDWRPGDQKVYISDTGNIARDLGWKPEIKVNDGLSRLIDWTQNHQKLIKSLLH
jgi:CDP-paratose 2-epimerase